jgi:hypothetical protein
VCGGKGRCDGGICVCNALYAGRACQIQKKARTCRAVGDPHWTTFDGKRFDEYVLLIPFFFGLGFYQFFFSGS